MPAATTHGDRSAPVGSDRPVRGLPRTDEEGDPASLDAAQNAALASRIRHLAAVRPEIVVEPPAADRLPQRRGADPAAAADETVSSGGTPRTAPSEPPAACPPTCPHARSGAQPRSRRTRRRAATAAAWLRPLWHLSAAIGAATAALGAGTAVLSALRALPVLGP